MQEKTQDSRKISRLIFPALIFAGAFALRVYFMRYHPVMIPDYDGAEYADLAKNVTRGLPFYTIFAPPLFPVLIRLAMVFIHNSQSAGMYVSVFFGSALCIVVYLLVSEIYAGLSGRWAALMASALCAVFPGLIVPSTWVMTEMTYAFFVYTGLYFGLRYRSGGEIKWAVLFGTFFGLGYLARPEGADIFAGACVVLLVSFFLKGKEIWKRAAGLALAAMIAAALSIPYMIFLRHALGVWTLSGKVAYNLQKGASGPGFGAMATKYLSNFPRLWHLMQFNYPAWVLVVAAVGAGLTLFQIKKDPAGSLFPFILLGCILTLPFFMVDERIMAPYYPVILIFFSLTAAYALEKLSGLGLWSEPLKRGAPALILATATVFCVHNFNFLQKYFNSIDYRTEMGYMLNRYITTGGWIKMNTFPGEKVLAREHLLEFYSNREWVYLPDITPAELWRLAKSDGARYVIIDDGCTKKNKSLGPLFRPWMGMMSDTPGFKLRYNNLAARVLIYEVV
jgi:4-amino-4-deoxy-L-arabinose transferase-like glycosyltransferase